MSDPEYSKELIFGEYINVIFIENNLLMYGCSVLNYKKDFSDKLLNFLFSFIVHDSFVTKIFCNYEKYLHEFQT